MPDTCFFVSSPGASLHRDWLFNKNPVLEPLDGFFLFVVLLRVVGVHIPVDRLRRPTPRLNSVFWVAYRDDPSARRPT